MERSTPQEDVESMPSRPTGGFTAQIVSVESSDSDLLHAMAYGTNIHNCVPADAFAHLDVVHSEAHPFPYQLHKNIVMATYRTNFER